MKTIRIFVISMCIIFMLSQSVFALGQIFQTAKSFEQDGNDYLGSTMDSAKIKTESEKIYNLLLGIAIGVAIIVGAILAIKFMTAGINEKVDVKQALFPYLISCIIIFGAMGIWKLVVNVLNSAQPDLTSVTVQSGSDSNSGSSQSKESTQKTNKNSKSTGGGTSTSSGGGTYSGGGSKTDSQKSSNAGGSKF